MTDVIAVPEGRVLAGVDLTAFLRSPFGAQCARAGLVALASTVGALAICALLPNGPATPTPAPMPHLSQASAAASRQSAGFDVARAWDEERAQLFAAANPDMRIATADAWSPAGGMSTLLASRFPSIADVKTENAVTVPLPPPAPVARVTGASRPAVARNAPASSEPEVASEPQVASLPPQSPEPGYFGFFRKLFEGPDHAAKVMLDANPNTAIYDIEHRVVYLPDGDKIEAHSGYGKFMDDPESVDRKNLGVTPPNVYAVSFREKLFHGVRALRMTPVGSGKMYGRDGILAHSYMLGEDGQSNGCVSVKDYDKFLQAYEDGKFKRIIVLRSIEDAPAPAQVASAHAGNV